MAVIPYWMNYVIFFTDDAEYQFATAVAGGNLLEMTPRDAAALFGIPFPYPSGDMALIPKGIYFISPFTVGSEYRFPNPSGLFVNDTVLTQIVPGQAGNPPSIWPAGPDGSFTWSGNIVRSGGGAQAGEPVPTAIPQRRWMFGRELSQSAEGATSISSNNMLRDSSRTIDGFGWAIRGNASTNPATINVDVFRVGLQPRTSWERFYIRVRKFPSVTNKGFWRCSGFPSAGAGCRLKIETDGTIKVYNVNSIGTEQLQGTLVAPVLNQWYRVDVLLRYGSGDPGPGIIVIYLNGVFALTFSDSAGFGMDANSRQLSSTLGDESGIVDVELEMDFDDWISADLPANCDPATLGFIDNNFPIDWLVGSHVRSHYNDSVLQVGWAPAAMGKGVLNQHPVADTRLGTSVVTSATSGATIEGLSDALPLDIPDSLGQVIGAVAAIIANRNINSGSTDGQLGYRKAGAAAVLITIDQSNVEGTDLASYLPTGMILPDEISPWSHVHTKSIDANTDTQVMMVSAVEYIGVWGPEDDPLFNFPINRLSFLHNARYGNTAWGYLGSQPAAPVFAVGGTYVGNGTYQEIVLPAPCHMLLIRPPAVTAPTWVFGSSPQGHFGATDRTIPNVRMWFDFIAQQFKFAVVGGVGSGVNVSGTTYQYIAFCDPGMRFNLCGAFRHGGTAATPIPNPLIEPGFLADLGFAQMDQFGVVSNADGLWARGPGFTANNANSLNGGALLATAMNFAAGIINSFSGLHSGNGGINYSLWRTADSGGACAGIMVQIMQYTGNGSNPRVIPLTPTSGRFPLLVCVIPANGNTAFMRDPSHTGTNSEQMGSGSNSTTAIIAVGLDSITVQSSLNANGIIYSVFAICGDSAGMNNGVFIGDFCEGGGPYIPPLPPQGDINVLGNGGIDLNGTTPLTLLKDVSGIYTLIPGKRNDTLLDRQTGQDSVDVEIPDPTFKTGYVGG